MFFSVHLARRVLQLEKINTSLKQEVEREKKKIHQLADEVYTAFTLNVLTYKHLTILVLKFKCPGPSCSKLTMSLVNDSLKFTSNDTQIC